VRSPGTDERVAAQPAIEVVAHHLRRLADRLTDERGSCGLRFAAAQSAYDHHLRVACTALGVEEHLDELVGVDHAIERARVEGRLQELGLVLRRRAGLAAGSA
jgi:hypothetical protein